MSRRRRRSAGRAPVATSDGVGRAAAAAPVSPSVYGAADLRPAGFVDWNPPNRSADAGWLPEREISTGRIRDVARNEGWASAGVDRAVDMLVGAHLRLNAKPDPAGLGVGPEVANEIGKSIQTAWRAWAEDPIFRSDAERQLSFSGLAALVAREFVAVGEGLAVLRWLERPGWTFGTAIHVVEVDRLSNPYGRQNDDHLRGGVEKDENGAPIAYHMRRSHPGDVAASRAGSMIWNRIPRWDVNNGWERPKVLHVYDKREPGQSRGVSRLVASLLRLKMLSRYTDSEVRAAAINASIVGAIYTQLGAEYAAEAIGVDGGAGTTDWGAFNGQRSAYYDERLAAVDGTRLVRLFPSDRLDLNSTPRQTAGLPAFQTAFLQSFASTLGISYEQLSMDWSRTNYSSARAALNEVWRGTTRLRQVLIEMFAQPVYIAFLEEILVNELIDVPSGLPSFYEAPAAWSRANWIGPGRGYIDPTKEAEAAIMRIKGRLSTLEREAGEQGVDWEQNLDQIEIEEADMRRRNMDLPSTGIPAGGLQPNAAPRDTRDDRPGDEDGGRD